MSRLTVTQAEDAAKRFVEAGLEEKKWKAEKSKSQEILRTFCDENPETKEIGDLEVYKKKNPPKLVGDRVIFFVNKLKTAFKTIKPNVPAIQKAIQENDTALIGKMEEYDVRVEQVEQYHFKRK